MEHPFRGGPSCPKKPEKAKASGKGSADQKRRDIAHGCLERMTLFFRRPNPGYYWTRYEVLIYGKPTALISRPVNYLPRFS